MITSVVLAEEETEETTLCEGCGMPVEKIEENFFHDVHGGNEDGYYHDDCVPRCYRPCCDPDYYNDLRDDR